MSGYVYLFIPKNGQPNAAMALFFFIGIIFVVIGITQLFFKRKDDKSVMDSITKESQEQKIVTMPAIENKQNRAEEALNRLVEQEKQRAQQQVNPNVYAAPGSSLNHQTAQVQMTAQHTNSFSHLHQYKGPVQDPSTGVHIQHPISQHMQQQNAQHNASTIHNVPHHTTQHPTESQSMQHHPVQNTTEHSIKCGKCSNVNPGHSNYCHKCGNRLK
jgi:FtsZ-interacting cell division protein ZipA